MIDIEKSIPHRPPFLFVDRIEKATKEGTIGFRTFTSERDEFFRGHFPGFPIVPGVILVETMAQCGGAGVKNLGIYPDGALFFLAIVDRAKFRRQVRPGEEVRLEIENLKLTTKTMKQRGKAFVGDEVAAEAEWLCVIAEEGAGT